MASIQIRRDIALVEAWLDKRGWELQASGSYWADFERKRIGYWAKRPSLPSLLHECGHILCRGSKTKFKHGYPALWSGARANKRTKADILFEEASAWHRGYALGRRLGIRLDEGRFWSEYATGVLSYARIF
jgi:hypothetical protein